MSKVKGFDTQSFMSQKFKHREVGVDVPDLSDFFPEGEKPVWTVRGLTADEVAKSREAPQRAKKVEAIMQGIVSGNIQEQVKALREELGITEDVHEDIIKRKEYLVMASVKPVIDESLAVKLANTYPIPFYNLTTKILELTGLGQEPGKSKPSGDKETSRQV